MKKIISYIVMLCSLIIVAQQTPAAKQSQDIAIVGATAHIGDGTIIENSLIILKDGKISAVHDGKVVKMDLAGMKIIKANDKHAYPGFIAANAALGLVEVDYVRASKDRDEVGDMIPHVRSLIAYNAESKIVETMRPNGVLIAQISPEGGRISGTSSIIQLDAWNWEDASIGTDDGIHLNWPRSFSRERRSSPLQLNKDYENQITEIENFITESKAYLNGDKTTKNIPFEAMQGLFNGIQRFYVHVNNEKGIIDAIAFSIKNGIPNMVIIGGTETYKVTDLLKQHKIPVLLNHSHSLPANEDQDYDLPFKAAKLLVDAGVLVGIQVGSAENFQARNLPFYAGTCAAYGLGREEALKLITSNTAKILGIDNRYGTLETGKSATLFISEGDALDMRTNNLIHAFIDGREISLDTHQTELWKRYSEKYNNQ